MTNDKAAATYHPGDRPPPRDGWSWAGAVALVLAVCVGVGWAVALVVAATEEGPAGPRVGTFLATVGGALVGAVVGWLGASRAAKVHPSRRGAERVNGAPPEDPGGA